ncbi:TetR/AcrR family transcriptional regulator [Rhodanobacter aciditrophus]|uniref:TetR/AcrR family transcriptional regulator n=1 Tax=Rhodanobacter aciditrophus TaxID=1623218 RepID=A0ABW4AYJ2_9GAMM
MEMNSVVEPVAKKQNPTKLALVDAAERSILKNGYKAMSFRDLAEEVGIKSASVHYHFPTKGDLVAQVMRRYREDFAERLTLPKKKRSAAQKALNKFIDGFKAQVVDQDNMSICTILMAEKSLLEEEAKAEVAAFYDLKLEWLSTVVSYMSQEWITSEDAHSYASQILASLHGASVLVKATGNPELFEHAVAPWRDLSNRF